MDFIVVGEIEKTYPLASLSYMIPTPLFSHTWKYNLWVDYVKYLPFMADTDTTYGSTAFIFQNLIVDYEPYYLADSISECFTTEKSYYVNDSILYVHFKDHDPPFMFGYKYYGRLYGFTNKTARRFNRFQYMPGLEDIPSLSESADPVEYSKMAFQTGSVSITNTVKTFDSLEPVFGNDFNIKLGSDSDSYEDLINVKKFYIDNYTVSPKKATFSLKDKRALLSVSCPSATFNKNDYPYLDDDDSGKIIPDAFGSLHGVPGICINATQGNVNKVFKFASVITSVTSVSVYKSEKWATVTPVSVNNSAGTITLSVTDAHDEGDYTKGVVNVKMDGVFRPESNPGAVIAKINEVYGGIPYTSNSYDLVEFNNELSKLADIGLYMGSSKDIYEWIEKIQNGSTIGFQYLDKFGRITARLDNPNRTANTRKITPVDIVNIEDVEVDYNASIYASSAKIGYKEDINSGQSNYYTNTTYRTDVLEVHRKENQYETDSLLQTEAMAILKSEVIMDDQKTIRPIYRNIKLSGYEWLDVRLYDIITATISLPGVLVSTPYTPVRNTSRVFAGEVRCQVVERTIDISDCSVTLSLRQRDYSDVIASILD